MRIKNVDDSIYTDRASSDYLSMRIAHVIDYFHPELGYQETHLARTQALSGHDVLVVTSDRTRRSVCACRTGKPEEEAVVSELSVHEELGIDVLRLKCNLEFSGRVWLKGLIPAIVAFKPSALHVHGVNTLTTLRIASAHLVQEELRTATLVVDDHMSSQVSRSRLRLMYALFPQTIARLLSKSVNHFVAVSDATKDFMVDRYGLAASQISVIRLGVDTGLFAPNSFYRRQVRQELSLQDSDFLAVFTGKITPRKGIDVLIRAVALLTENHPGLFLLIIGYGDEDYCRELQNLATVYCIAKRVLWIPRVSQDQLAKYFAAADAAIWPGEHTISIYEAMATGLPLIVGDVPKSREDVIYGNGFITDPADVNQLALHLASLVDSTSIRTAMGIASLDAARRYYSWTVIDSEFQSLYQHSVP